LDGNLRVAHALGKVLDLCPAAIETPVVAGEEQIHVRFVGDEVVIDRQPRHARRLSVKEVLRPRPGLRLGEVVGGAVLRLLRLEDQVPLLVWAEVEQARCTVVPLQARIHIDVGQLGLGGIRPVLEIQVHHRPSPGGGRVGGRVDVPQTVVADDRRVLDGYDRVVGVVDRLDQHTRGLPVERGGKPQLDCGGRPRCRNCGRAGRLGREDCRYAGSPHHQDSETAG